MPDRTTSRPRLSRQLPLHTALDLAAEVALIAAAGDRAKALSISKGTYDRVRQDLSIGAPTAEALRRRVGGSWAEAIELALTVPAERGLLRGPKVGRPDSEWSLQDALTAIQATLLRTGSSSAAAYDGLVADLERDRSRRGESPLALPSASTIAKATGGWAAALRLAGAAASKATPNRPRPAVETLDEVITRTGLLPGRGQFERYCRAHDIPLGRDVRGWDHVVAVTRARRAARGDATPECPTPARQWPPLPGPTQGRLARRKVKGYTREQVLESIRLMDARHRRPHHRLTEKRYRAACAVDSELIPSSCLARHGRFQDLVREAGAG